MVSSSELRTGERTSLGRSFFLFVPMLDVLDYKHFRLTSFFLPVSHLQRHGDFFFLCCPSNTLNLLNDVPQYEKH